jgi:hypothetical protein
VIMGSALHRMRLYQGAYGLTELRLYTTVFMLWLGVVFCWFGWTVLRGRRERFAWGALTTALEALVLLHVVNPDGMIVRVNAARADAPTRFDAPYAASLSADAVPPLLAALPAVRPELRCMAAERLLDRWHTSDADWRSWSLARGRARAAVAKRQQELKSMTPCAPVLITLTPATVVAPASRPAIAAPVMDTTFVQPAGAAPTSATAPAAATPAGTQAGGAASASGTAAAASLVPQLAAPMGGAEPGRAP